MNEINLLNREEFAKINAKLYALNPMAVLSRGYGVVYDENNDILKSINNVLVGNKIKVRLCDGELKAIVTEDDK
jgi:exodeoxyribonuclease VII large subunit